MQTNRARKGWQQARTCANKRSAKLRSRVKLTTPPNHNRVDTIIAKPIQASILWPFTRMRIRLYMNQIEIPCFNQVVMNHLAVGSCTISPTGNGSFVQSIGMNNRLNWAPI